MWSDLTESEKFNAVKVAIEILTEEGQRVTGKNVGEYIGTSERTGREWLGRIEEVSGPEDSYVETRTFHKLEPQSTEAPYAQVALILPDWQVGMHDAEIIEKSLALAEYLQPDKIVHVGDESDCTAIGRWARGTKDEWESNLQEEIDTTHDYLSQFREMCPNATFDICFSNHMQRFANSVETRLPGFRTLRALTIESLYGLDELGITMQYQPFEIFPDVIAAHGHQYGLTSAGQYEKGTRVVKTAGKGLIAGHTHRPMLTSVARGYNANMSSDFYLNVGCAMDFQSATYISSRQPEWGFGLGVVRYESGVSYPELLIARDRNFYFEGLKF
jgi:hypothetical protein